MNYILKKDKQAADKQMREYIQVICANYMEAIRRVQKKNNIEDLSLNVEDVTAITMYVLKQASEVYQLTHNLIEITEEELQSIKEREKELEELRRTKKKGH